MQRANAQPMFTVAAVADLGSPRAAAFFDVCDRDIPWADLAASVADVFPPRDPSAGGAPHWPLVTLLKITLLQRWFALSDPMAEEMLEDRISFRRFAGLSFDDKTPDHSTICVFRKRRLDHGHGGTLFD